MIAELSHQELSLLVFALERAESKHSSEASSSCEEVCPAAADLQDMFGGESLTPGKRLARHLGNHLREGWVDCGMLKLMGGLQPETPLKLPAEDQGKLREINQRLSNWRCEVKLSDSDLHVLRETLSRLPRSAWLSMPRTLWRLRKKLRE